MDYKEFRLRLADALNQRQKVYNKADKEHKEDISRATRLRDLRRQDGRKDFDAIVSPLLSALELPNDGKFKVHEGNRDEYWGKFAEKGLRHYRYRDVDIFIGKKRFEHWSSSPQWAALVQPKMNLPIHRDLCTIMGHSELESEAEFLEYVIKRIDSTADNMNNNKYFHNMNCRTRN